MVDRFMTLLLAVGLAVGGCGEQAGEAGGDPAAAGPEAPAGGKAATMKGKATGATTPGRAAGPAAETGAGKPTSAPPAAKPRPQPPQDPPAHTKDDAPGLQLPADARRPVASLKDETITLDGMVTMLERDYSPGCREIFSLPLGTRVMDTSLPLLVRLQLDLILVREEAKRRGIQVDRKEVRKRLEGAFAERMKERIWRNPARERIIRASREHDFKVFRRTAGPRSEIEATLAALHAEPPTRKELKEFYRSNGFRPTQKVKVAHIFIPRLDPETNHLPTLEGIKERTERILDIKGRLKQDGSNFAEVAERFSALEKTARRGGLLGLVPRWSEKYPAISRTAFSLAKGEWTGPVEEVEGFHFIKCLGVVNRKSYLFYQVYQNNREKLEDDLQRERREKLLLKLRRRYRAKLVL